MRAAAKRLSWDQRERLIDGIMEEFCATGLRPDSEPNERGLLLEELRDEFLILREGGS